MKVFSLLRRGINLTISLLAAIGLFVCGVLLAFTFGDQQRQEIRHLEQLPVQDAVTFGQAAADSEMIVTGVLDGNKARHDSGLVAYAQEHWDVTYDGDNGYEGDWETIDQVWPALLVLTSSGRVKTAAVNSASYGDEKHSEIIRYSDSSTKAEGIPEGSLRVTGYMDGDTLTVVGYKSDTGLLVPIRFYGGTHGAFIKEQKQTIAFLTNLGALVMIFSPLILISGTKQGFTNRD